MFTLFRHRATQRTSAPDVYAGQEDGIPTQTNPQGITNTRGFQNGIIKKRRRQNLHGSERERAESQNTGKRVAWH